MPYKAAKSRTTFKDLCTRLDRHGFRIIALQQFQAGAQLQLQVVVGNARNLELQVQGPLAPPHWGEDLFYQLLSQVELFGDQYLG